VLIDPFKKQILIRTEIRGMDKYLPKSIDIFNSYVDVCIRLNNQILYEIKLVSNNAFMGVFASKNEIGYIFWNHFLLSSHHFNLFFYKGVILNNVFDDFINKLQLFVDLQNNCFLSN